MARTIVALHAPDGTLVGTAQIDTADGEPLVLQADTGVMYVLKAAADPYPPPYYVEAIPLAVIVKRADR